MRYIASILRFLRRIVYVSVPVLLIVAIGWSAFRVIEAVSLQQDQAQVIDSRREAYRATATALASGVADTNTSMQANDNQGIVLVQQVFATNTPDAPLATNTTEATQVIPPTPVPTLPPATLQPSTEKTPFALPELFFPPDPEEGLVLEGTAVPTRVPAVPREYELVNILLLGGDDELTSDNFPRTDTMIVVSINTETGSIAMLSFPRDLFVYIPNGVMARMNVAYAIGDSIGWQPDGGFGLLRQTIFYNFGINVHYFVKVNFSGFEQIIDTLGGVDIGVDCAYQDYYPVDDFDPQASLEDNYYLRTLNVGYYTFDGFDALWYARTRKVTDDFDRGRRQQQILRAMWRKARDNGQLTNLPTLWNQLMEVVDTNLTFETMLGLLPYAVNMDINAIDNYTMIRTYHTTPWQPPSGDYVQLPVYDTIRPLMEDFYRPPTASQLSLSGPSIAVYNGSSHDNWDRVAVERLLWGGFNAVAMGTVDGDTMYPNSVLTDRVASDKGSISGNISKALNIPRGQIQLAPDPARDYDYEVIIGDDYSSCTFNVLPVTG